MIGLSRDYNSKIGLGHLYGLASRKPLPRKMVEIMMKESVVPDTHPTVLEFIQRWNQLCLKYEGKPLPPHPQQASKSLMMWNADCTTTPLLTSLPLEFYQADHIRHPGATRVPKFLRLQIVRNAVRDERVMQNRKVPLVLFYDKIMQLKLFIQEAEDLGFFPLAS